MADNYLQFSEVIAKLTEPEEAWLKEQLQPIRVFGDKEYPEDAVPAELADTDPDWTGVRFLRDKDDHDPEWDALGFEYSFHDDHDPGGWGRHLWLYAEESGNARQRCLAGAEVSQEVPARPVLVAHLRHHLLEAPRRRVRRRGGVRHGRRDQLAERLRFHRGATGGVQGEDEATKNKVAHEERKEA